jgi:hypothetical protein
MLAVVMICLTWAEDASSLPVSQKNTIRGQFHNRPPPTKKKRESSAVFNPKMKCLLVSYAVEMRQERLDVAWRFCYH